IRSFSRHICHHALSQRSLPLPPSISGKQGLNFVPYIERTTTFL
ncbi:2083_t:CDS:1, partial [Dentiscutata heterogama]